MTTAHDVVNPKVQETMYVAVKAMQSLCFFICLPFYLTCMANLTMSKEHEINFFSFSNRGIHQMTRELIKRRYLRDQKKASLRQIFFGIEARGDKSS